MLDLTYASQTKDANTEFTKIQTRTVFFILQMCRASLSMQSEVIWRSGK